MIHIDCENELRELELALYKKGSMITKSTYNVSHRTDRCVLEIEFNFPVYYDDGLVSSPPDNTYLRLPDPDSSDVLHTALYVLLHTENNFIGKIDGCGINLVCDYYVEVGTPGLRIDWQNGSVWSKVIKIVRPKTHTNVVRLKEDISNIIKYMTNLINE